MWPYSWTHVGTPSQLGHMDRVAATMPSQAHAGAAQEAANIGQWEGQDVPLVRPSSCTVKGGIPSSRRYLPTYLWRSASWKLKTVCGTAGKVSAYDGFTERNPRYRLDLLWILCAAFAIGCQQGLDDQRVFLCLHATSSRIFSYPNQPMVQKARKVFSFSHVKAKQDQECGGKVCRNTKGSASCFSHVKAKQGQD